jgi:hypothetical protein
MDAMNTIGYGGLLCNNNGDFILGFYGAATVQSILFAELMGVERVQKNHLFLRLTSNS